MHRLKTFVRDGLDIHFLHVPARTQPEGAEATCVPILVLSHGFPGNAFDWGEQLELFPSFEVLAPFMHGTFDGKRVPKSRIASESLLQDMEAMLETVDPAGTRPLYFVGHDLGCFLNVTLAERFGERVRGLVNINGVGMQQYYSRLFGPSQWIKSFYVVFLQFALFRALVARWLPGPFLRLIYRRCGVERGDTLFAHDKRVFSSIYVYKVLLKRMRSFIGKPVRKIAAPTVFIWGNRDAFLDIPHRREVDRFYSAGEVRVIKGGHWVSRSNAAHVNRILAAVADKWLSAARDAGGKAEHAAI